MYISDIQDKLKVQHKTVLNKSVKDRGRAKVVFDQQLLNRLTLTKLTGRSADISILEGRAPRLDKARRLITAQNKDIKGSLLELYALLVLTTRSETTLANIHDAWAVATAETNPKHKSLVPFSELSDEDKEKDQLYLDIVLTAVTQM